MKKQLATPAALLILALALSGCMSQGNHIISYGQPGYSAGYGSGYSNSNNGPGPGSGQ
ncbi:MAG TPA: hypothetical protein PLY97_09300 [Acidocella sp.]|nr:hypothetical protein [Acidocella sp.]